MSSPGNSFNVFYALDDGKSCETLSYTLSHNTKVKTILKKIVYPTPPLPNSIGILQLPADPRLLSKHKKMYNK